MAIENQIEVLNDLIRINNDRVAGYAKASEQLTEDRTLLVPIFERMQTESMANIQELRNEVLRLGGQPDEGTTAGGKLYRSWMDLKATFGGDTASSVLNSCEGGEDAAKASYTNAIESGNLMDSAPLVQQQRNAQQLSHNQIKTLRDQYANR